MTKNTASGHIESYNQARAFLYNKAASVFLSLPLESGFREQIFVVFELFWLKNIPNSSFFN
jgi:hypothetical protein